MSDSPFLRPGSDPESASEVWPYEPPQAEPERLTPQSTASVGAPVVPPSPTSSSPRRRRGSLLVAGLVGLVVGGVATGWLMGLLLATPDPMAITLEVFPEYIENLSRPDLAPVDEEGSVDPEQFKADFEAQREDYRFAYGGDGASVDYGQFLMTIVNGSQPLPMPSGDAEAPGSSSPILVSLDSGTVSCVFRPEVGLYNGAVLQAPADLSAAGWTLCVLNDGERHVSLKLESSGPGGAVETSSRFARILERTHKGFGS